MGTTLTGTTPQDTYDSLIKVTDNGPLSGTAKYLSDGLGNDSVLALSTSAVGIGTATPSSPLDVIANNATAIHLRLRGRASDNVGQMELWNNAQDARYAYIAADSTSVGMATTQAIPLTFATNTAERMRIDATGNVGIGTSAPASTLDVSGTLTVATTSTLPLTIQTASGNSGLQILTGATKVSWLLGAQYNIDQSFEITPSTANGGTTFTTPAFLVKSSGNVGIGTSAPVAKLQTTGSDAASIITGVALENFIATNPSSGNGVAVDFRLNNSGNTSVVTGKISTVNTFFRSNTDMVFSTFTSDALTEKARILSSGGITFNGDTAAANALDDYEEGTFTPTIEGSTTAGTATYVERIASYTKIGRIVHFAITMNYNLGTGTGNLRISNLPFTSANEFTSVTIGAFSNVSLTAGYVPASFIGKSLQAISFEQYPTGGGTSIPVPYDAEGIIFVTGSYSV